MKKIIICSMLLILATAANSQKTTAWILLGSGVGIAVAGGIVQLQHENSTSNCNCIDFDFTGAWIAMGGGIVSLSSIPFFIASGRNKRKGMSLFFKNETAPQIQKSCFVFQSVPSLTLKINL